MNLLTARGLSGGSQEGREVWQSAIANIEFDQLGAKGLEVNGERSRMPRSLKQIQDRPRNPAAVMQKPVAAEREHGLKRKMKPTSAISLIRKIAYYQIR